MDKELEEYRTLMEEPSSFEEGFSIKTVVGALFIGFIMMPGAIYLGLVAGQGLGPAAEWVTIILFTEAARRSLQTLRRQEIYILYYVAASLTSIMGGVALSGGAFAHLIWNQYLVQSEAAQSFGMTHAIPEWVVPPPGSEALAKRTFFHPAWLYPIVILVAGQILSRLSWFSFGYTLFRVTSDIERLPFPMAPIAAQGATALAEVTTQTESWRWHVFSTGAVIGLAFGTLYVGIPSFTGSFLTEPLRLIPVPWVDTTVKTEKILPGAATGIATNLEQVLIGFVLPFWVVVGGFLAALATLVVNPILYRHGLLPTWEPGMDTITTNFSTSIDFWMSATIGTSIAVGIIGIGTVIRHFVRAAKTKHTRAPVPLPEGRGDFPIWLALALFVTATVCYIILCKHLVPTFPIIFLLFFGFIFTPLNSYINARMIGLTGQWIEIPMVREATFILSQRWGYKGIDIWFAPIPLSNYGGQAQHFRVIELTGTKITSVIKAELLMLPIMLLCSFLFWQYMWRLGPIPSNQYPYAQTMWHLFALRRCLWMDATMTGGGQLFRQAIKPPIIYGGIAFGLLSYGVLSYFRLPVMLVYGFIRGMGSLPHMLIPEMFGALLGRFYFARMFGLKQWRLYATVLLAGFACGMGLVGMGGAALAMVVRSVRQMPY